MRELKSDEARRGFRDLLDEVERDPAAAIKILRYERPVAVVVSAEWYEQAQRLITAVAADLREAVDALACRVGLPAGVEDLRPAGTADA